MTDRAREVEEAVVVGLLHDPRRLHELAGFDHDWFTVAECKLLYWLASAYHARSLSEGRTRYATAGVLKRDAQAWVARAAKDKRKSREAAYKAAVALMDDVRDPMSDDAFKSSADEVREIAMDRVVCDGILKISEGRRAGADPRGMARQLRDLVQRVQSTARDSTAGTLERDAASALADYEKAKSSPNKGFIPTPFREINESCGGGKYGHLWLCAGYAKDGKAQPVDCPVLTPSGWKPIGQLKVGDRVVDPDGGTAKVVGVFPQGQKPAFRVTMSDGTSTECCDEHLWTVHPCRQRGGRDRSRARTLTIKEIASLGTTYMLPQVVPVDLSLPKGDARHRPLDPYLLGVLLGDGCLRNGAVSFSSADRGIIDEVAALVPHGIRVARRSKYDYGLVNARGRRNDVTCAIRNLGLAEKSSLDKFIPDPYLWAPASSRLAILQGLLDTDGYAGHDGHNSGIEYSTSSPWLAQGVRFLAQSLGWVVREATRRTFFKSKGIKKEGEVSYRLRISPPPDAVPFRLTRKMLRWRRPNRVKVPGRTIRSIEFVGVKEQVCIAVDSQRSLYVTDDFIVTHNTMQAMSLIYHALRRKFGVFLVTGEQTRKEVRDMLVCRHSHQFTPGGLPLKGIARGTLTPEQEKVLKATIRDLGSGRVGPITYDEQGGITISEIRSMAEAAARRHRVDVIMVDHTDLFEPTERQNSDVGRLAKIMKELKKLALDFADGRGVWVVACHQIKRDGYEAGIKRGFYVPSDLAGTAEAERSCDVMTWILRDEKMREVSEARIGVAVDRRGPGIPRGLAVYERFESAALLEIED